MTPFFTFPLRRLVETSDSTATSVRTLSDAQLRAEREALREACAGTVGVGPAALMLSLYDAEASRRQLEGFQ